MRHAKLLPVFLTLLWLSLAQAAGSLVIQPFSSPDLTTGVAVSLRLAEAFSPVADVYGPAVAPSLTPPVHVAGGFYNPASFLTDLDDRTSAAVLRSAVGSDTLVNGRLDQVDQTLLLVMNIASADAVHSVSLQSPVSEPDRLVRLAVAALAQRLEVPAPPVEALQLDGTWIGTVAATHFLGIGNLELARQALDEYDPQDSTGLTLKAAIEAVEIGSATGDPALLAILSLARPELDEAVTAGHMLRLAQETGLPAAWLWHAQLMISSGQDPADSFDRSGTVYGQASKAAYESDMDVAQLVETADAPALLALGILAQSQQDVELEHEALTRLTQVAPTMVYPFERLSFLAFDADQPLAAARALAVATRLEPGNSLYWTNLGWAQYLLGLYAQSEESSVRALVLAPNETVAGFNLGLVRAVTGRLEEALEAYSSTLAQVTDSIDEAAIDDLRVARQEHPAEPAVAYSLGWLLEASGQRDEAAAAYRDYLQLAPAGLYSGDAERRLAGLFAPAPEMELPGGITLLLAGSAVSPDSLYAGDVLTPRFEVYTRGDQLPMQIDVTLELHDSAGTRLLRDRHQLNLPVNTVGFVVDGLTLMLPEQLEPGNYVLTLTLSASEDRTVSSSLDIVVIPLEADWVDGPDPVRRLLGLSISMTDLQTGLPLYTRSDMGRTSAVLDRMLAELQLATEVAEEVLPSISQGRFSGLSGGEAFREANLQDIADFLGFVGNPANAGANWNFAEAFAQWIVDGTPD